MAKKSEELLARARASATTARKKAQEQRADFVRRGTQVAAGYMIGKGAFDFVPRFGGAVPRTASLAVIGIGGSMLMGGRSTGAQMLAGLGDAALTIASYQMGKGETVSGGGAGNGGVGALPPGVSDERRALAKLRAELDDVSGYDDDDDDDDVGYDDDDDDDDDVGYDDDYDDDDGVGLGDASDDIIDVAWEDAA